MGELHIYVRGGSKEIGMRIIDRNKKGKTATILIGAEHMHRIPPDPIYCPFCEENGNNVRLFDVTYLQGRMEHKCAKCGYLIFFEFNRSVWTTDFEKKRLEPRSL